MPSIPELERLLALEPGDPLLLYGLAQEYAKAKETARAVEYYDRCLQADPAYCYAYYHKAKALGSAGRRAEAMSAIKAGIAAARKANDLHAAGELETLGEDLQGG